MGRCKLWGPWIPSFYMPLSYLGPNPVFLISHILPALQQSPWGLAASAGLQALCSLLGAFILGGLKSLMTVCCSVTKSFPTLHKTPWTAAHQASLSPHHLPELAQVRDSWVGDGIQPSHPLPPPSLPALNLSSIRVFSNESAVHIRWPKYWSFSIRPSNEYSGLISFKIDGLISLVLHPCLLMWPEIFHFTKVI